MKTLRSFATIVPLCLCMVISAAQDTSARAVVKVSGEVMKPLQLHLEDLHKLTPATVTFKDRNGTNKQYKGVALYEILALAGVTMGKQLRGENLAKYILVKSTDGYEVVFSLAETDTSFTDKLMVLAYESDGQPLSSAIGPFRLIVQGEKKPARSSFQVTEIVIKYARD